MTLDEWFAQTEDAIKRRDANAVANKTRCIVEHMAQVIIRSAGVWNWFFFPELRFIPISKQTRVLDKEKLVDHNTSKTVFWPASSVGGKGSHSVVDYDKAVNWNRDVYRYYTKVFKYKYPNYLNWGEIPEKKSYGRWVSVDLIEGDSKLRIRLSGVDMQNTTLKYFWAFTDSCKKPQQTDYELGQMTESLNQDRWGKYVSVKVCIKGYEDVFESSGVYGPLKSKYYYISERNLKEEVAKISGLYHTHTKEWVPVVEGEDIDFVTHILKSIESQNLRHTLLLAEGGSGKTTAMMSLAEELFNKSKTFEGRDIIPVFIPAFYIIDGNLTRYLATMFGEEEKSTLSLLNDQQVSSHFLILVDGINETPDFDSLQTDILRISQKYKNATFIVSSQEGYRPYFLSETYAVVRLSLISEETREKSIANYDELSEGMKTLLGRPFFINLYQECSSESVTDEYSLVREYLKNQVDKVHRTEIVKFMEVDLPRIAFKMLEEGKRILPDVNIPVEELVKLNVLRLYGRFAYFSENEFFYFFCAKYIYDTFSTIKNECAPDPQIQDELTKDLASALKTKMTRTTRKLLADALFEKGEQYQLLKMLGSQFSQDRLVQRAIVAVFAARDEELSRFDFSKRDLWVTDFTMFRRLAYCVFNESQLNPETLFFHDSHIHYEESKNYVRVCDNHVLISDPKGIELYNFCDDRKVYIFLNQEEITHLHMSEKYLFVNTDANTYVIKKDKLFSLPKNNQENFALAITEIENETTTDPVTDEVTLRDSKREDIGLQSVPEAKRESFRQLQKTCISNDVDHDGNVLFRFADAIIRYSRKDGSFTKLRVRSTSAWFLEQTDRWIFVTDEGIYKIFDEECNLRWQKTVASVIPYFHSNSGSELVVRMTVPGKIEPRYFTTNLMDEEKRGVFRIENRTMESQSLINETMSDLKDGQIYEGTDSYGYKYYRCEDSSLRVYNQDDELLFPIYGSAIDFTGSVFTGVTLVGRKLDDLQKVIIQQFGGMT